MIVPKPAIVFHTSQIFFNFLCMACFASVASFQAKWKVGPSGLTGFTLFVTIAGMFLSAFMLLIPVAYEKYDKFIRLARALKEVRVGFILTGTGTAFSLLIAFIVTISAWTQPGCKDPNNDPNAEAGGDDFKAGLPGWCNTKKAGAIFLWLAFGFWAASFVFLVLQWRSGKLGAPRDPPFRPPQEHDLEEGDDEEEEGYTSIPPVRQSTVDALPPARYDAPNTAVNPFSDSNQYSAPSASAYTPTSTSQPLAGRPSMDAYGAFSDPAPTGFGTASPNYSSAYGSASPARTATTGPPIIPEPDLGPRVSRTMQYADPYAAVRATVSGQAPPSSPPSYDNYTGYR
ncbi:hypothetical protein P691DRAFT_661155 [Macrolepiota fuliginosa MF-IS2]|uniref:MARVEL domain-containing protein n=1 Tax=Macrolepiota fuliginosa MF-IS2 TaxID=1400762 RepID=A0A9P5XMA7_9AGAR|nr:hypothetical protein P691DRAFT_661155 [Macrolepiota fuliginosa MF-IS2]